MMSFNRNRIFASALISLLLLVLIVWFFSSKTPNQPSLRAALAQMLMLDLRYYCKDTITTQCTEALTQLPDELGNMVTQTQLGGVILFADNLTNIEQIVTLNHDLQTAARASNRGIPLFIGIDQEGGRVARLPRDVSSSFSGAMAIGATYEHSGAMYAELTGKAIAEQIKAVGFNLNFAPTVDVNVNPLNPVINVRSFGDNAQRVGELGWSQLQAMQEAGVIATLKHFPGHGDTNVDSHTGLPVVNHSVEDVTNIDLAPFQYAFDKGGVEMVMTAHIQYPELDNETFVSLEGHELIKPATMSRKILTDLLRNKMHFNGVIITDALDMAGISHFYSTKQAVLETFKAGADIALMPLRVRTPSDIQKVDELLDFLEESVTNGELKRRHVFNAYERIYTLKQNYHLFEPQISLEAQLAKANAILPNKVHQSIERKLAEASLVVAKGNATITKGSNVHMIMPDAEKCEVLTHAISAYFDASLFSCSTLLQADFSTEISKIKAADALILSNIAPRPSLAEIGGAEDINRADYRNLNSAQQQEALLGLAKFAQSQGKKVTFVSLRTPYDMQHYAEYADTLIAAFSYNSFSWLDTQGNRQFNAPTYFALAKLFAGELSPTGVLPVSVDGLRQPIN